MSGIRGIVKDGWHPKGKDGGRESWRGDFKGINQVAGWVGKGKDNNTSKGTDHVSRPLSTLQDPSTFGPPPRRINSDGGAAAMDKRQPERKGSGALAKVEQVQQQEGKQGPQPRANVAEAEVANLLPPPLPFRKDTTGLSTKNPPPELPARRSDVSANDPTSVKKPKPVVKPKPPFPPRLPPRGAANTSPSPPPGYEAVTRNPVTQLNQDALSRLSNAGISVPALGIKRSGSTDRVSQGPSEERGSPQHELQTRFAKMTTSPATLTPSSAPPDKGTTMEEKEAAIRTAQSFHRDPRSVSASDARKTLSTANNFRERHGEQIEAGRKKLNGLNQKYGITKRINDFIEDQKSPAYPDPQPSVATHPHSGASNMSPEELEALNRRKPPPPPPPTRPEIHSSPADGYVASPPPLPLGTKPRP